MPEVISPQLRLFPAHGFPARFEGRKPTRMTDCPRITFVSFSGDTSRCMIKRIREKYCIGNRRYKNWWGCIILLNNKRSH